jgi:hypothetical protein
MTVVSLVLIVGAVALLGYGLLDGSNLFLAASILASVLAAGVLLLGARRSGRAAVADAVKAEQAARGRRRSRREELVGAGVGGGDRSSGGSDDYDSDEVSAPRETALLDVGARRGVPAQAGHPPISDYQQSVPDDYAEPEYGARYGESSYASDAADDDDPDDEPAPQRTAPADAARVAQLDTDVLVIDGRPRYHLHGCVHLLGREHEPLPVSEAVELGFSPCGLCEPDSALLASARRV